MQRWVLRVVADDLRDVVVRVLGSFASQDIVLDGIDILRSDCGPLVRLRLECRASKQTIRTAVRLVRRLVCVARVDVLGGGTWSVDGRTSVGPGGENLEGACRAQYEGVGETGGDDLEPHG